MVAALEEARAELAAVDAVEQAASEEAAQPEQQEVQPQEQTLRLPEGTRRDLMAITQQIALQQKELAVLNDKAGTILRTLMQVSGVSGKVTGLNLDTGLVSIGPLDAPVAVETPRQGPVLLAPNRSQRRRAGKGGKGGNNGNKN